MCNEFYRTGFEVGIYGSLRAVANASGHRQDEFTPNTFGYREDIGRIRITYDLQQTLPIPQVDEDDATVIAPAMHPAGHANILIDQALVDLATIMCAHAHAGYVAHYW